MANTISVISLVELAKVIRCWARQHRVPGGTMKPVRRTALQSEAIQGLGKGLERFRKGGTQRASRTEN